VAKRVAKTAGVDINPAMLAVAQQHSEARLSVDWRCSDAGQLAFANGTFDLCLCLQGLQHFPERAHVLGEIRRTLKPGGRFVASVWAGIEHNPGLFAVLHALEVEDIDASAFKRPFSLGDSGALGTLVRQAEFSTVDVQMHERPAHFASVEAFLLALSVGSAASREALQKVPQERWGAFAGRVEQELAAFTFAAGLVVSYRAHVAVATR
jgi:SAM-dependent methyltransferase